MTVDITIARSMQGSRFAIVDDAGKQKADLGVHDRMDETVGIRAAKTWIAEHRHTLNRIRYLEIAKTSELLEKVRAPARKRAFKGRESKTRQK